MKGTRVMKTSIFYSALPAQRTSTQTSSKNSNIICLKTQRLRIFRNIGMNLSLLIAQLPKIMISVDVSSQITPPLSTALTADGLFFVQLNTQISTANWKKLNYLEDILLQLKIKILLHWYRCQEKVHQHTCWKRWSARNLQKLQPNRI